MLKKSIVLPLTILFALLLSITPSLAKQPDINVGPKIGSPAPALHIVDTNNHAISLEQIIKKEGAIIVFFRSADWCPFCKKHLIELNEYDENFKALGYGVAAISYDNTDILKNFSQFSELTYPLYSDQEAATVNAYGVRNTDYEIGDDNYGLSLPGVIVVNQAGKVVKKYFFEGYRNRVKFNELLKELSVD